MHPTVERTLETIKKKSQDTGVDITDTLEEWVKEVHPGQLEQNLYALGPNLNLGSGMFDMSFFVPEDEQLVDREAAVIAFERQLLYDALYEQLTKIEPALSSFDPDSRMG